MSQVPRRFWSLAAVPLALAACGASAPGASSSSTRPDSGADALSGESSADAGAGGSPVLPADGDSSLAGYTVEEVPRVAADPTLTHRLVAGQAALEGSTYDSCSNAVLAQGDHWCAFSRVVSDARTELWVLNFTKAAARGAPAACDGTSPDCLLLTSDLWTDFQIWGDFQPVVHRFDGDTLIFHAGPAPGKRDPYDGGIWAWRPGWMQARLLTDHGVFCLGNQSSASIACVANAQIERSSSDPFATPYYREFDLLAGDLGGAGAAALDEGPLPTAAHVTHVPDDMGWRVRLSPDGKYLAYSSVPTAGAPETLKAIPVSDAGVVEPSAVLSEASEWEIANDGKSVYFLEGYARAQGDAATGTLKVADFPSGANPAALADMVRSFELVGAYDRSGSAEDRGLVAVTVVAGGLQPILIRQPRAPADAFALVTGAMSVDVASDLRHSVYVKGVLGNPVIWVERNDGSGVCQLTADSKAESYAPEFTADGTSILWIERIRRGTRSNQGWVARSDDCGARVQFGDYVSDYQLVGDDFVVFQGYNADASTLWLEYTRLPGSAVAGSLVGAPALPTVIKEHPDINVHVIRDGAGTWIVFSVLPQASEPAPGLYVHGPLLP